MHFASLIVLDRSRADVDDVVWNRRREDGGVSIAAQRRAFERFPEVWPRGDFELPSGAVGDV